MSEIEGPGKRRRPVVRWKDWVKEYMQEGTDSGVGLEQARKECLDREGREGTRHQNGNKSSRNK